jgi:hypothetical protein
MEKWVVGSNMPGYMPDEPPHECDSFEDALQGLIGELERDLTDLEDDDSTKMSLDADTRVYLLNEAIIALRGRKEPQEQGFTIGNRHYFLSRA